MIILPREKVRVTLKKQQKVPLNRSLSTHLKEISNIWKSPDNVHMFDKHLELFIVQKGENTDISWNLRATREENDQEYNERVLRLAQEEQEEKQRNIKLILGLMEKSKLTIEDLQNIKSLNISKNSMIPNGGNNELNQET